MSDPQQQPEHASNSQPSHPYAQPGQPYAQPGQPYSQPGQPYGQSASPDARPMQSASEPTQPPYPTPQARPSSQPGQPYAQPGQPYAPQAQPYSHAGQPSGPHIPPYGFAQNGPSGQTGPGASTRLGRTAFIITVAAVIVGLLVQVVTPFLYSSGGYTIVDILSSLVNLVVLVAAAVGLVLGIVALRRPAPHLLAAIAIGIGGSTVAGILVSWASTLFSYIGF